MKKILWVVAFFAGALWALPLFAQSPPPCAPAQAMHEMLGKNYGEKAASTGLTKSGMLIEVFSSEGGSTWTILLTGPDGISCALIAGEAWRQWKPVYVPENPA